MKKLLAKIKDFYNKYPGKFIKKLWLKVYEILKIIWAFLNKYVFRYLKIVKEFLLHNWLINFEHTKILLFGNRVKVKITNKRREAVIGASFIFIWIIGYLIFSFYPVFYSLYLSFFKVRLNGSDITLIYQGLNNFKGAFTLDPLFVEYLVEYIISTVINVPVVIVFALIIAMLINQDIKGKGVWRTIFFLPVVIASGPIIGELINQGATTLPSINNYDIVNLVLNNVGDFLANPIQQLLNQILLILWFAGIQILIILAGLQKIDKSIYEASMIDGASPWESFWKITLPSIMPLISVTVIYTVVSMSVFSLNEVIIYIQNIMTSESTVGTIITGYGYSAALAWIYFITMSVIIGVFVGLLNVRRRSRR